VFISVVNQHNTLQSNVILLLCYIYIYIYITTYCYYYYLKEYFRFIYYLLMSIYKKKRNSIQLYTIQYKYLNILLILCYNNNVMLKVKYKRKENMHILFTYTKCITLYKTIYYNNYITMDKKIKILDILNTAKITLVFTSVFSDHRVIDECMCICICVVVTFSPILFFSSRTNHLVEPPIH